MTPELIIEYEPTGRNGTATVTARIGADVLAAEKVDLLRPKQRGEAAARIAAAANVETATVDQKLLQFAGQLATESKPAPAGGDADLSLLVRPELFHTSEVSGVAVPAMSILSGKP